MQASNLTTVTSTDAMDQARVWAAGRSTHVDSDRLDSLPSPAREQAHAAMIQADAHEVQRWTTLALALRTEEDMYTARSASSGR